MDFIFSPKTEMEPVHSKKRGLLGRNDKPVKYLTYFKLGNSPYGVIYI